MIRFGPELQLPADFYRPGCYQSLIRMPNLIGRAIAQANAERDKRLGIQMFSNFFRTHKGSLKLGTRMSRFLRRLCRRNLHVQFLRSADNREQ